MMPPKKNFKCSACGGQHRTPVGPGCVFSTEETPAAEGQSTVPTDEVPMSVSDQILGELRNLNSRIGQLESSVARLDRKLASPSHHNSMASVQIPEETHQQNLAGRLRENAEVPGIPLQVTIEHQELEDPLQDQEIAETINRAPSEFFQEVFSVDVVEPHATVKCIQLSLVLKGWADLENLKQIIQCGTVAKEYRLWMGKKGFNIPHKTHLKITLAIAEQGEKKALVIYEDAATLPFAIDGSSRIGTTMTDQTSGTSEMPQRSHKTELLQKAVALGQGLNLNPQLMETPVTLPSLNYLTERIILNMIKKCKTLVYTIIRCASTGIEITFQSVNCTDLLLKLKDETVLTLTERNALTKSLESNHTEFMRCFTSTVQNKTSEDLEGFLNVLLQSGETAELGNWIKNIQTRCTKVYNSVNVRGTSDELLDEPSLPVLLTIRFHDEENVIDINKRKCIQMSLVVEDQWELENLRNSVQSGMYALKLRFWFVKQGYKITDETQFETTLAVKSDSGVGDKLAYHLAKAPVRLQGSSGYRKALCVSGEKLSGRRDSSPEGKDHQAEENEGLHSIISQTVPMPFPCGTEMGSEDNKDQHISVKSQQKDTITVMDLGTAGLSGCESLSSEEMNRQTQLDSQLHEDSSRPLTNECEESNNVIAQTAITLDNIDQRTKYKTGKQTSDLIENGDFGTELQDTSRKPVIKETVTAPFETSPSPDKDCALDKSLEPRKVDITLQVPSCEDVGRKKEKYHPNVMSEHKREQNNVLQSEPTVEKRHAEKIVCNGVIPKHKYRRESEPVD